jgi:dihydroneopterin aldolase
LPPQAIHTMRWSDWLNYATVAAELTEAMKKKP